MSLADDVREAVADARETAIGTEDAPELGVTVTHRAWTGQDYTGVATYAETTYLALVEAKQRSVRTSRGTEEKASHYIGILEPIPDTATVDPTTQKRTNPVDPDQDRFILPDGRDLPILAIDGLYDGGTDAPFYSQVWLG